MKKRFMKRVPNLETATTDELFTALIKRVQKENPYHMYFIDKTNVHPYPTWSMYHVGNIVAKEVK